MDGFQLVDVVIQEVVVLLLDLMVVVIQQIHMRMPMVLQQEQDIRQEEMVQMVLLKRMRVATVLQELLVMVVAGQVHITMDPTMAIIQVVQEDPVPCGLRTTN